MPLFSVSRVMGELVAVRAMLQYVQGLPPISSLIIRFNPLHVFSHEPPQVAPQRLGLLVGMYAYILTSATLSPPAVPAGAG
jgi:hypothetical protein